MEIDRKRLQLAFRLARVANARSPETNSQMMDMSSTGKRGDGCRSMVSCGKSLIDQCTYNVVQPSIAILRYRGTRFWQDGRRLITGLLPTPYAFGMIMKEIQADGAFDIEGV
jgi:hypothetical protein